MDPKLRAELEQHWRRAYYALANGLYKLDSRDPDSARALARAEFGNLSHALGLTLEARDPDAMDFADRLERFLNVAGRWRERDDLLKRVRGSVAVSEGPVTRQEFLLRSQEGQQLLDQGRPADAEALFRRLLKRMGQGMAYEGLEAGYDRALTHHRLGRSLMAQGRMQAAESVYRQELETLAGLDGEDRDVQQTMGTAHTELADVLSAQGRYDEAKTEYEAALKVDERLGDQRGAAVDNGQLGTLALRQKDYAEARRRYRNALEIFQHLREPRSEATLFHQLGRVAEEQAKRADGEDRRALLAEADEQYRQSYQINESNSNWAGAAGNANQLAIVARYADRHEDAERWFLRALNHFESAGQQSDIAMVRNNLANLFKNLAVLPESDRPPAFRGRDLLAESEDQARRAAEIRESLNDPSTEIWTTYGILAAIATARADQAEKSGNPGSAAHRERAAEWRRKERAAYCAFPGHWQNLKKLWAPVAALIARAAAGDPEAGKDADQVLTSLEGKGRTHLTPALRAVIAGARDPDTLAETHDLDGLDYLMLTKVLESVTAK